MVSSNFLLFNNFTQIKTKSFEGLKSIRNYEKNNAWNIGRLVDESFVQLTQHIILKIVGFLVLFGAFTIAHMYTKGNCKSNSIILGCYHCLKLFR